MQFLAVETSDIQSHITIEAVRRGRFGGTGALDLNKIRELDAPEPEFLVAFKARLQQRRWISDTVSNLIITYVFSY